MEIENKIREKIGINDKIVIYYSEIDKKWIALSLETMVIGIGDTMDEAYSSLKELLKVQVNSCERFGAQLLFPLPQKERFHLVEQEKKKGKENE